MKISIALALFLAGCTSTAIAEQFTVTMHRVAEKGVGESIGTIEITHSRYGIMLTPALKGLPPGTHGFHIHQTADCSNMGEAAGGHYDPQKTASHEGPYRDSGHQGDLAVLVVDKNGTATTPVLAPRLKMSELKNHALMIHAGGDNYSDQPEKLGGGGARIACGIIK